ncbi:MAG: hypothetical protein JNL11_11600 [Bdellovibrionaceae bacterium]|nr:hypothetical protein [Pseudobdellovibrionaceae bacterium]
MKTFRQIDNDLRMLEETLTNQWRNDALAGVDNRDYWIRGVLRPERAGFSLAYHRITETSPQVVLLIGVHRSKPEPETKIIQRTFDAYDSVFKNATNQLPSYTLVMCDSHGEFNGIANEIFLKKSQSIIQSHLGMRGTFFWLSVLNDIYGLDTSDHALSKIVKTQFSISPDSNLYSSLLRGAKNRGWEADKALKYAALRIQEQPMMNDLLGNTGIFLAPGDPETSSLFAEIHNSVVFCRMKPKTGMRYVNQPFWVSISK